MSATPHSPSDPSALARRDVLLDRLIEASTSTMALFSVHIGDRLAFYDVLASEGALTPGQLAVRTGTHERYVREWLEHQAVVGIVAVEPGTSGDGRRFYLPAGHDEVLADRESLNYLAPLAQITVGAARPIDDVVQAFRTGGGVPFGDYGRDMREGQARMNRAAFLYQLGGEWIPAIPDVDRRLGEDPPARIGDLGCGAGWSAIGLARTYGKVVVDGFDLDAPSIEMASRNAVQYGVQDRVRFAVRDAGAADLEGQYDLVTAFECVHDMANPVAALRVMRALTKTGGTVLVVDERAGEAFEPMSSGVEGLLYGFSVLHCLPSGMADSPSAGTGTLMRPDTFRRYAAEAGFTSVETLPIDHLMFRFYRLTP